MRRDCDTCRYFKVDFDYLPCSACSGCDKWEAQTNADHIRSMTDDELAEFLSKPFCENYRELECHRFDTDCVACCISWLKEIYEVDT